MTLHDCLQRIQMAYTSNDSVRRIGDISFAKTSIDIVIEKIQTFDFFHGAQKADLLNMALILKDSIDNNNLPELVHYYASIGFTNELLDVIDDTDID